MIAELTFSTACIVAAAHVRSLQIDTIDESRPSSMTPKPPSGRGLSPLRAAFRWGLSRAVSQG